MISCLLCLNEFKNEQVLTKHLQKVHSISRKEYADQWLKLDHICPFCGQDRAFKHIKYDRTCGSNSCIAELKRQVYLERYGVINPGQRQIQRELNKHNFDDPEKLRARNNKTKQTSLVKYSTESPNQAKEVQDKSKQTLLTKYGVAFATQLPQCKTAGHTQGAQAKRAETLKQNNLEKYGAANVFQLEAIKIKSKKTKFSRYGNEYWTNPEKATQTCLLHFGVRRFAQSELAKKQHHRVIRYNNLVFDSKLELAFYLFCVEHQLNVQIKPARLPFFVDNKLYYYFPDFSINNIYYECKGKHLLKYSETGTIIGLSNPYTSKKTEQEKLTIQHHLDAKYACMLENNIQIITGEEDFYKVLNNSENNKR